MHRRVRPIPALAGANWPGIARGGNRTGPCDGTTGSSRQPCGDADSGWSGCPRAVEPRRPAPPGYLPDGKAGVTPESVLSDDTLELAPVEAWAGGGSSPLSAQAVPKPVQPLKCMF